MCYRKLFCFAMLNYNLISEIWEEYCSSNMLLICFLCWLILGCGSLSCYHDEVSFPETITSFVNYRINRGKRDNNHVYEPLKIHLYYDDIDHQITSDMLYHIDTSLRSAINWLSELLYVEAVSPPFLLERKSCIKVWSSGDNAGMCSSAKSQNEPEYCENRIDKYRIPNEFLQKLDVYNFSGTIPWYTLPGGKGLHNANFILFMTIKASPFCFQQNDVQAYGSYCRVDQYNRPVAGLLNFCPNSISKDLFDWKHLFYVAVHEFFHILGFSRHLFDKYMPCLFGRTYCNAAKRFIQEDSDGVHRLLFPLVAQTMQKHLNCSSNVFGAPLESVNSDSYGGVTYGSHWHPLLMFSSIMAPTLTDNNYIVIDNITLSVFASTGWYKVNFSKAENYGWGKGQGCDFGLKSCKEGDHRCGSKDANLSADCHYKQYTTNACDQLLSFHPCGVYNSNIFIKPICIAFKCSSSSDLSAFMNSFQFSCPDRKQLTLKNGIVYCPFNPLCASKDIFANDKNNFLTVTCPENKTLVLTVRLFFEKPSFKDTIVKSIPDSFKANILNIIASDLNISMEHILSSALFFLNKKMFTDISICLPIQETNSEKCILLSSRVQKLTEVSYGKSDLIDQLVIISEVMLLHTCSSSLYFHKQDFMYIYVSVVFLIVVMLIVMCIRRKQILHNVHWNRIFNRHRT